MNFKDFLKEKRALEQKIIFDGAMGTTLMKLARTSEKPPRISLTQPNLVAQIHKAYANAGADVISANTFGVVPIDYSDYEQIISASIALAKSAGRFTALDIGSWGRMLEPYDDFTHEECEENFKKAAETGLKAGADLIIIETMISLDEAICAIKAAKNTGLPVVASMSLEENGKTFMGDDIPKIVKAFEDLEVDIMGINCGYGPEPYQKLFEEMRSVTKKPILVMPNAGLPEIIDGEPVYNMNPEQFAAAMKKIDKADAYGGCCGTTPEHIARLRE